ncbi:MAG: hypothetical protein HC915_07585 [Anaerolineae bacterium]|nr:hypothetical protein [Anaerolineae bacterium]
MSDRFINPASRRLLFLLQLYFLFSALLLLVLGAGRVALEFLEVVKTFAAESTPALTSTASLVLGGLMLAMGYGALYTFAAVGAKEPPAFNAIRLSFLGLSIVLWALVGWGFSAGLMFFGPLLLLALLASALMGWLWWQVQGLNLWQVFGQRMRKRRLGSRWLRNASVGLIVVVLVALSITFAVLTRQVELPPAVPEPGELLYSTTFDAYNDEWDLPQGRQSAEIVDGELILSEGVGLPDSGFYSLLKDRRFSDFDLRLHTRQLSGSDDNRYGVIFRQRDVDNYYHFEISGDGFYRLLKAEDGNCWKSPPGPPAP